MTGPLSETGHLSANGVLLTAPLLGLAFGFFLERGGLGSAPKLAAQFYLRDLTVFKVMFSALLTAMLGAFWLDRAGLLNLALVEMPETFVWSQAAGGVLFGIGFLLSGLCPGTSCVAAAAGRLDGVAVIGGILLGIVIFNSGYSWWEPLYIMQSKGAVTIPQFFSISRGLTIFLITAAALAGFAVAERLEQAHA